MSEPVTFHIETEEQLGLLAGIIALKCRPGDVIALHGDLGAGKTTFARAFIRSVLADPSAEVPSPTFSILQSYYTERFTIDHFDLYRLAGEDELGEIGFVEDASAGVALVEWPERAGGLLPAERIDLSIAELEGEAREVTLEAHGPAEARMARVPVIYRLIEAVFPSRTEGPRTISYLQGDASTRAYAHLAGPFGRRVVMDSPRQPDGPPIRDGLPYSQIAHLAEDIAPFLAIGDTLRSAGFSAPGCDGRDAAGGVAIFEDLGNRVFGTPEVGDMSQPELWKAAVEVLLAFRAAGLGREAISDDGHIHTLPIYDARALQIEIELLVDWYLPSVTDGAPAAEIREEFLALWRAPLTALEQQASAWVLRDFHSPNLIWLPEREGVRRVGLLDFQDAQFGHAAYDLMSLLQDARLDVPEALESELFAYYAQMAAEREPDFDSDAFAAAYALLGAQRNTKILGIFTRLAVRDGKPGYLRHIPRIWRYLMRNLQHPSLSGLKRWYERHVPDPGSAPPRA